MITEIMKGITMTDTPIYFITVFSKCELNNLGWLDTGYTRCWGFYYKLEDAIGALHNNSTDIHESTYNYAMLEKYYQGISNEEKSSRIFFEWSEEKQGFYETSEPESLAHTCSFAIG